MDSGEVTVARVGPNAITQLGAALITRHGHASARRVFQGAGIEPLLADPPATMMPEETVARTHRALQAELGPATASAVAEEAGRRTADYLLAWRIPRPVQAKLKVLPCALSARLLLAAIRRNAWTFAGSGRFAALAGRPHRLTIAANPIATPGCPWHRGVFRRLFEELVTSRVHIRETACCARGDSVCRFEIRLDP